MSESPDPDLIIEQRGAASWLVLNRPRQRNALTVDLVSALADALAGIGPSTRAVVITGTPPAFCSGGDLADLGAVAERGALAVSDVIYGQFHRLVGAIAAAPVPVIAAVNGPAMGAGLDLALCCDLRYADIGAKFASSWINVGLVPGMGGAHMLSRVVGPTRAAEIVLLGEPLSAEAAMACGILNDVVSEGELDNHVAAVVTRIEALSAPALSRSKAALRRARDADLAEELATLGAVQGSLLTGADFRAATERFRQ